MGIWKLKSCPRCGGDMFVDTDLDGWYELCIQCSCRNELKSIVQFGEKAGKQGWASSEGGTIVGSQSTLSSMPPGEDER